MLALLAAGLLAAAPQDALATMPRFDRYEKLRREITGSVVRGDLPVTWSEDGKELRFRRDGKRRKLDLATLNETDDASPEARAARPVRANPERGRQFSTVFTPDGKRKAFVRDRNVLVSDADGKNEQAITTDGSVPNRIKNGEASWVYGEELGVREAMWFSPDGEYLAYYRFDETKVQDYFLALDVTKVQNRLDAEAYPKAGTPNPEVSVRIRHLASGKEVEVAKLPAAGNPDASFEPEYLYEVRWSPDGKELFYHVANRKQNRLLWLAANRETGAARLVYTEAWPTWTENSPPVTVFKDARRYILVTERTGFRNLVLRSFSGSEETVLTRHDFDVDRVVAVDEARNQVWYTARSGNNPYLRQLHRVGLDGKGETRLTDPSLSHTVNVAPDFGHFTAVSENTQTPPTTTLYDRDGKPKRELAKSDTSKFEALKLQKVETFTFPADDGGTTLYGELQKPSDFDPDSKYPLVLQVYAGPDSGGAFERFQTPNPLVELGFLMVSIEGRGTNGRGKAFKDALYGKLGIVEVDDQAAGVRYLTQRPYVDPKRIGVTGTSYGGYATIMLMLRYPDLFHVGVANSSVTAWENYDTIYTERYQGLPWENENLAGYKAGSSIELAKNLAGKLMLFYGTADNNVHPANTYQLARALNAAGKTYWMMAGPDQGHTALDFRRTWSFFAEHLLLPPRQSALDRAYRNRRRRISLRR